MGITIKRNEDDNYWQNWLLGSKAKDGTMIQGNIGNVAKGIAGIAEVGLNWASLNETKAQNRRIDAQNKINSANAANAYNSNLEAKTDSRLSAMGMSNSAISDYLKNSEEYKKKKAKAYT